MTKERAGSLLILAAGMYGLLLSLQLPMGKWNEPGPGAFPLVVSILLCCAGCFLFISGKGKGEGNWRDILKDQWTPFQIVLFTALFIAALNRLGYLLTSSLYVFALLFWVSRYKLWIAAGIAVALGIGSWYLFGQLLETPLPRGVLTF